MFLTVSCKSVYSVRFPSAPSWDLQFIFVFLILLPRWQYKWKNTRTPWSRLASTAANSYEQPAPSHPSFLKHDQNLRYDGWQFFSNRFHQLYGDGKNSWQTDSNEWGNWPQSHVCPMLMCFLYLKDHVINILMWCRVPYNHGHWHHSAGRLIQPNTKPPGLLYALDSFKIYNDAIYWHFCQLIPWACCKVITRSPDAAEKLRKLAWRLH